MTEDRPAMTKVLDLCGTSWYNKKKKEKEVILHDPA
jgi:hypothetical protein